MIGIMFLDIFIISLKESVVSEFFFNIKAFNKFFIKSE